MSARVQPRVGLLGVMGLLVLAYTGGLALHGDGFSPVVDGWLAQLMVWVPAAVCWAFVARAGRGRSEIVCAAAAVTAYAVGKTYYVVAAAGNVEVPFPGPGGVGCLLFYPLMMAALIGAARRHMRSEAAPAWLDGAVGFLGSTAVMTALLGPALGSALAGGSAPATVVALAYPIADVLLMAVITGLSALPGQSRHRSWPLLTGGLTIFAATDVVSALRIDAGTYRLGTMLDAGWALGLALVAVWVDHTCRHAPAQPQRHANPSATSKDLAVSAAATVAGMVVLMVGTMAHISAVTTVLAGATLLAATARTQFAFHQLVRMTDLRRQVATDDLTGLPNRRALYARATARLADPQRPHQALLMLDLNRFKEVNDSLGHHAGDQLLIQVSTRLSKQLQPGDLLVRLGGDEFAVLLADAGPAEASAVATKLCTALVEPFSLDDLTVHSSASIGIALFPDHGPDLSTLLRKADIAMYKAKASNDGQHLYGAGDQAAGATRLRTVEELHTALAGDQLVVHYQPKIDLHTGAVRGVEALVRWDHPTRGLLYPGDFLDLVEEGGLMPALTQIVLERALDQAATWEARGEHLTVAVNLSASALVSADLPENILTLLANRGLPPSTLQIEITEEFLMGDRDRARTILTRLRNAGIQIAVDDFGTGYSSLAYLRDLPIDELKLDQSFIYPMADDTRAAALVASTIDLAHSLDLRMVAEGVESQAAYTELTRLGCDQAQGYYMSRPLPAAELDDWLSERHATTAAPATLRL